MQRIELPYHEAGILTRLVGAEQSGFSPAAAEGILELGFSPTDKDRMHALAGKARSPRASNPRSRPTVASAASSAF